MVVSTDRAPIFLDHHQPLLLAALKHDTDHVAVAAKRRFGMRRCTDGKVAAEVALAHTNATDGEVNEGDVGDRAWVALRRRTVARCPDLGAQPLLLRLLEGRDGCKGRGV